MAAPTTAGSPGLRESHLFDRNVIAEIQRAAREGIYDIRGFGAKRRLPHFDDLLLLGASISRYPLEGYRERCGTDVVLGTRLCEEAARAEDPGHDRGHELRRALRAGEGGARPRRDRGRHLDDDRRRRHDAGGAESSKTLVYQLLPSRYGMNPDDLRRADAIEVVVGQGAKPGGGGMLLGHKISDRVAEMRDLPKGSTSAARRATPTGPGRTTSRSRSSSCARSPTGRSPSS